MEYKIEVYEKTGACFCWYESSLEEVGSSLKHYYSTKEEEEFIEEIRVFPSI